MDEDVIGFTYFLSLSYKQHKKDFPFDEIKFHDFSSICLDNWEQLGEEAKKKINDLAKKEQEEERKPKLENGKINNPINLETDLVIEENEDEIYNLIDIANTIHLSEEYKKGFGQFYSYCKKSRSAYIYFVKAARVDLKDKIRSTQSNFIDISRAISAKWREMKVSQRKIFEDLAILDKKFNGFKLELMKKKKQNTNHTPLFLKAKVARNEIVASTSTGLSRLSNPLNSNRSAAAATRTPSTKSRRKTRRKKTKKRKTTTTSTTKKRATSSVKVKREVKREFKSERKIKVKRE